MTLMVKEAISSVIESNDVDWYRRIGSFWRFHDGKAAESESKQRNMTRVDHHQLLFEVNGKIVIYRELRAN